MGHLEKIQYVVKDKIQSAYFLFKVVLCWFSILYDQRVFYYVSHIHKLCFKFLWFGLPHIFSIIIHETWQVIAFICWQKYFFILKIVMHSSSNIWYMLWHSSFLLVTCIVSQNCIIWYKSTSSWLLQLHDFMSCNGKVGECNLHKINVEFQVVISS